MQHWAIGPGSVVTGQSGNALTIADTNSTNVFGISRNRAQLTGLCNSDQFVTAGSIESKLNNYFDKSCFTTHPVIGADGLGTAFGNSGTGIVDGPGESNFDIAVFKIFFVSWPRERPGIEFRTEFFNAFNHPQFAKPDSNITSPTFGAITLVRRSIRV